MSFSLDATLARADQISGLLRTSDGKDKAIALLQYVAMFASGGEAGTALAIQKSLGAARKPFRVFKPIETLMPLLTGATLRGGKRRPGQDLARALSLVKTLGMTFYFAADHVVWAGAAGVLSDKSLAQRAQKVSYWSWCLASLAGLATATRELTDALDAMTAATKKDDDEEKSAAAAKAQARASNETTYPTAPHTSPKLMTAVVANATQATLALALLEKLNLSKRQVGGLGVFLSLLNCYTMAPALKRKTA